MGVGAEEFAQREGGGGVDEGDLRQAQDQHIGLGFAAFEVAQEGGGTEEEGAANLIDEAALGRFDGVFVAGDFGELVASEMRLTKKSMARRLPMLIAQVRSTKTVRLKASGRRKASERPPLRMWGQWRSSAMYQQTVKRMPARAAGNLADQRRPTMTRAMVAAQMSKGIEWASCRWLKMWRRV